MAETESARARGGLPLVLRVLLTVGFAIAIAATALVVFADDVRMLRLAALLALWAALIAAFAVTRSRREAKAAVMREGEAQLAYQLELHREVAARREYEADLSQQVASAQADQLSELREQLERLTGVLSTLVDGELTVSRLTLSAESARFRPGIAAQSPAALGDPRRMVTAGPGANATGGPEWVEAAGADGDASPAPGTVAPSAVGLAAPALVGAGVGRAESPSAAWSRRHAEWARSRDEHPEPAREQRRAERPAVTVQSVPTVTGPTVTVPEMTRASAPAVSEPVTAPLPRQASERDTTERGAGSPVAEPPVAEQPAEEQPAEEDLGDHESGVSVSDLLAAYGLADRPRRRRRD